MQIRKGFVGLLVLLSLLLPSGAFADQPQDWLFQGTREEGTYLTTDFLLGAAQATLENDTKIFGNANQFTLRANALGALPYGSAGAGASLRMLILTLGFDVGGEYFWRGLQCPPGPQQCNRKALREMNAAGDFIETSYPFLDLNAQGVLPFNDYSIFVAQFTYRFSDAPDRMYDYSNAVLRDGNLARLNLMLFGRHKDIGGFAPMLQYLDYTYDGRPVGQWNFGFTFLTRAGLTQRDDLVVLRMLFHDPSFLGGSNVSDSWGQFLWRGPLSILFVYRSMMTL